MTNDLCSGAPKARYVVAQNGNLSELPTGTPAWRGTGYYRFTGTGANGTIDAIISGMGGQPSGGFSSANAPVTTTVVPISSSLSLAGTIQSYAPLNVSPNFIGPPTPQSFLGKIADPVEQSSGAYTYQVSALKTGVGTFPAALDFGLQYSSTGVTSAPSAGRGWANSLDINAQTSGNGFPAAGFGDAWNMAEMIAEKFVSLDLLSDLSGTGGVVPLKNLAVATVGHRWIGDRIVNNIVSVSSGGAVEAFTRLADGTYNPPALSTARLAPDPTSNWIYTASDGKQFRFDTIDQTTTGSGGTTVNSGYQPIYRLASAAAPNGLITRFSYDSQGQKLTYVYNSMGRQLLLTWTGSSITNVAEYSSGVAQRSISLGYDASNDLSTITDPRGKTTLFCSDGAGRITSYFHPNLVTAGATCGGSTTPTIANTYDSLGRVDKQVDAGGHVTDLYLAGTRAEVVTHPGAAGIPGVPDISTVNYLNGRGQTLVAISPRTGKQTVASYDKFGRTTRVVQPEGNAAELRYDERSNVSGRCWIAKPPVGQQAPPCNWAGAAGQILTSTRYGEGTSNGGGFVFNCANPATCNLPASTFDAIGSETDYSYNPNGTVATVTLPTPAGASAAPQTSYAYTAYTMGSDTVSLPTYVASRIDSTANTVGTTYTYDTANNWVLKTSTVDSTGFNLTTTYGTDAIGNVTSVKGPRTDVDDTVTTAYDAARNPTQLIYAGTLLTQLTYDDDGNLISTARKLGASWSVACRSYTTTGQVASAFGPIIQASPTDCSFAGNPAVPLVQYQYDGADRLVRTSAVNTTETRTTRLDLLPDNRVGTVTRAEGTPVAQAYATIAYTDNGLPQTVTNALGRPTKSTYDGYDRLAQTAYPTPAGTLSTTDVVVYGYDPRGLVTTRSLRGTTACPTCLTFTYDALGRTASKVAPAIGATPGYTITYSYDLLGHMLSAGTSGAPELSFAYDKLGRATSAGQYGRTLGYAYGPASQGFARTVTWPSSATALSCTDALGRTVQVKDAGDCTTSAGQLVGYAYDDLSRRTTATDANGTSSSWGYDPTTGALASLSHTFASSASNVAFTLARNRVGEVTTYGIGNDLYEWTNHYNVARQYAANALDQYTNVGGLVPSYDAYGNLANDRMRTYAYDAENRLTGVTARRATVGLPYDPLGRLRQTSAATSTAFLYDGSALVGEYNAASGATLARYVPGPGIDETVVGYDAGGAKSWLHTDPIGSVVAVSNAAGATATIDEMAGQLDLDASISLSICGSSCIVPGCAFLVPAFRQARPYSCSPPRLDNL